MTSYLKTSVFLSGIAVMAAEMTAPRLLAPAFGTSQLIWTNIIGTVLAALTIGAFVGGRLADRWPSVEIYGRVIALAGVMLAIVPLASRPILASASQALAEQRTASYLLSLAATCLFFAPPIFLLGMISPWALRIAGHLRPDLGRVAGVISGLVAFGSILGTFLATLVALPILGTRRTLLATAALLLVTGLWGAASRRVRTLGAGVGVLMLTVPLGPVKHHPGQHFEAESLYQYVQVVTGPEGRTHLLLDEGLGSQSLKPADSGVLTGGVWDYLAALPALRPGEDLRVLILGLAGGTAARQIDLFYRGRRPLRIDGVEIDPVVIEAGRRFFELDAIASLRVHLADGRRFLASTPGRYDLIIADAYQGFYIPFPMVTREFYEVALDRLSEDGVFAINLATDSEAAPLLASFDATLAAVFSHVARFEVENESVPFSNFVYAASAGPLAPPLQENLPTPLRREIGPAIRSGWTRVASEPGALVFRDDHAPIEFFTDRVLLDVITR